MGATHRWQNHPPLQPRNQRVSLPHPWMPTCSQSQPTLRAGPLLPRPHGRESRARHALRQLHRHPGGSAIRVQFTGCFALVSLTPSLTIITATVPSILAAATWTTINHHPCCCPHRCFRGCFGCRCRRRRYLAVPSHLLSFRYVQLRGAHSPLIAVRVTPPHPCRTTFFLRYVQLRGAKSPLFAVLDTPPHLC